MQYPVIPCNTMQYHAIPCNTMQYHSIPRNTMQYHTIPCTLNNCWRSVPLPCGQYMAIFSTLVGENIYLRNCRRTLKSGILQLWQFCSERQQGSPNMANVTFASDGNVLLEKVWRVISTANKTRWLSSCQSAPSLQIWMRNGISKHPYSSLFSKNPVEALASLVNKQTKHIAKVLDNHTSSCFIIATVSFLKRCFIISKHWALSNHKKYVFYYKCSPFWQRRFDQVLHQNL